MRIEFAELVSGYEFPPVSYELSAPLIARYLEAVDSRAELNLLSGGVPPLAIAAYAMAAMMGALSLPAGSIHASQEFEFLKPVPVGATIKCQAKVARKISRAKMCMLALELSAFDESGERVQSGEATIVVPG